MEYAKLSRRSLLALGTTTATGVAVGAGATVSATPHPETEPDPWQRLLAGNRRFATGRPRHPRQDPAYRQTLVDAQHPIACVLGCADSRVPAEILFDQGLGDLFTVRAVGEVLDDAVVGSIEYAVEHLHVPLVVILGHTGCGAVKAAIALVNGHSEATGAVDTVARAIEATVRATPPDQDEAPFPHRLRTQPDHPRGPRTDRPITGSTAQHRHRGVRPGHWSGEQPLTDRNRGPRHDTP